MAHDARIAALEQRFGDPFDDANPLGFKKILDSDERAEPFKDGTRALDEFALNAELVPQSLGGRFTRLDDLIGIGRVLSRRDPALVAGEMTSSLLASACVWLAGSDGQRRYVADTLLAGHRMACAYHELNHGNDFTAIDFSAQPVGDYLLLTGRKELIANVDRAEALVVFAATGGHQGFRAHSQLLLRRSDLRNERVAKLPRFGTAGLRGAHIGGVTVRNLSVKADSVIGGFGRGTENTMKAFQLTRIALPAMITSTVDTALRCTVRHLAGRTLYGRPAIELPHLKSQLVNVFVTIIAAEALAIAAARSLHVYPGEGAVHAATVKYYLPRLLTTAMDQLAMILGAYSYLREGPTAIFQKLMRDLQAISLVHISRAACRMILAPQLPLLARRSWGLTDDGPSEKLFASNADLPPLDFSHLRVTGNGHDHLLCGLKAGTAGLAGGTTPDTRLILTVAKKLIAQEDKMRRACLAVPTSEVGVEVSPAVARIVDCYARLVMAAVCLETWHHNSPNDEDWMSAWAVAALAQIADGGEPERIPDHVEDRLFTELVARCADNRDLGLAGHAIFGA